MENHSGFLPPEGVSMFRIIHIYQLLLQIINAPITPGTHAQSVRRNTIIIDPQPLSITARGGNMIQSITRQIDITPNLLI
jgi:hypothetical protein